MLFQGRSLGQISQEFTDYLNYILNTTVTQRRLRRIVLSTGVATIGFQQQGRLSHALIQTAYGPMELDLRQMCDATIDENDGLLTLRTVSYRYALTPGSAIDPLLRWEFVHFPADPDATWCRNHIQGAIPLGIRDQTGVEANLNRWHLPSGPVAIEDVLRFCITDLGVSPLRNDWDQRLRESVEQG